MKYRWLAAMVAGAVLSGCEWESPDSETEAWNEQFNWVNINGTYRGLSGGGLLVTEPNRSPGFGTITEVVRNERVGTTQAEATFYSGYFRAYPVVPGTVNLSSYGFVFTDDGQGNLLASGQRIGWVNYRTGFWAVDLVVDIPAGQPILASYAFEAEGGGNILNPGNSGDPIYTMTVVQEGNLLTFYDSNGNQYSGHLGSVRSMVGNVLLTGEGMMVAQFEVQGQAYGQTVRIVGTFQASVDQTQNPGVLFDRQIQGTWIESGGRVGDVMGGAPNIVVFMPDVTPDSRPSTTTTNAPTVYPQ